MLALPEHLTKAYELAQSSSLVTKDSGTPVTNDMIREFAKIINDTIPNPKRNTYALYKFVRAAWKQGNLKDFTGFEPLILWLDNNTIMEHFKVDFKFMFRWDNSQHRYSGHVFTKVIGDNDSKEVNTSEPSVLPDDGYASMFSRIKNVQSC
jgi:hypothetical protein